MNLRLTLNFDRSLCLTGCSLCPKSKNLKLYQLFFLIAEKSELAPYFQLSQLAKFSHENLMMSLQRQLTGAVCPQLLSFQSWGFERRSIIRLKLGQRKYCVECSGWTNISLEGRAYMERGKNKKFLRRTQIKNINPCSSKNYMDKVHNSLQRTNFQSLISIFSFIF